MPAAPKVMPWTGDVSFFIVSRKSGSKLIGTVAPAAPACPPPDGSPPSTDGGGGSGGGGGGSSGGGLYICYYEVWTDLDGNIVDVFLIQCVPLSTGINVE